MRVFLEQLASHYFARLGFARLGFVLELVQPQRDVPLKVVLQQVESSSSRVVIGPVPTKRKLADCKSAASKRAVRRLPVRRLAGCNLVGCKLAGCSLVGSTQGVRS